MKDRRKEVSTHIHTSFLFHSESATVFEGMTIEDDVYRELQANIVRRFTPQPVRIRADIEVTCFSSEGIDAIKSALSEGENLSTEAIPIKVKLVAPPLYVLLTTTTEKEEGISLLGKALAAIGSTIKKAGGEMKTLKEVSPLRGMFQCLRTHRLMHTLRSPATNGVRQGRRGAEAAHGAVRQGERGSRGRRGLGRGRVVALCKSTCYITFLVNIARIEYGHDQTAHLGSCMTDRNYFNKW